MDTIETAAAKSFEELALDLCQELMRLSGCARGYKPLAESDPEAYVSAVQDHYLKLLIPLADLRAAHRRELAAATAA